MDKNNNLIPFGDPSPQDFETLSREEIKSHLTRYIAELLEYDFEKLCNLVYRHDVAEVKFHQALSDKNTQNRADNIAELVIERELQKVETRKAYKKYKEEKRKKEIND